MDSSTPSYRGHRFSPEIISHVVWLYHRFCLNIRDVEEPNPAKPPAFAT